MIKIDNRILLWHYPTHLYTHKLYDPYISSIGTVDTDNMNHCQLDIYIIYLNCTKQQLCKNIDINLVIKNPCKTLFSIQKLNYLVRQSTIIRKNTVY